MDHHAPSTSRRLPWAAQHLAIYLARAASASTCEPAGQGLRSCSRSCDAHIRDRWKAVDTLLVLTGNVRPSACSTLTPPGSTPGMLCPAASSSASHAHTGPAGGGWVSASAEPSGVRRDRNRSVSVVRRCRLRRRQRSTLTAHGKGCLLCSSPGSVHCARPRRSMRRRCTPLDRCEARDDGIDPGARGGHGLAICAAEARWPLDPDLDQMLARRVAAALPSAMTGPRLVRACGGG